MPRVRRSGATTAVGSTRVQPRPCEPHLRPRVGVGLTHLDELTDRIPLPAEVTGYDARGHIGGAHEHDEGRGVVAAEALARAEQELIDGISPEGLRLERIHEAATAQVAQYRGDVGRIGTGLPCAG